MDDRTYKAQLPNEFLSSPDDNRIRPFTIGVHEHAGTVATIILYTMGEVEVIDKGPEYDYLSELSMNIDSLESEAMSMDVETPSAVIGGEIAMLTLNKNQPNKYYGVFNNFSLLQVREARGEIVKLHQNFTNGWNAFFFGEKPVIYTFSGIFLDTMEYPYYQEFMVAYNKYLSGRKCIENNMQMKIIFDGRLVNGYILNIDTVSASDSPTTKTFTFSVLIQSSSWVRINLVPSKGGWGKTKEWNAMTNIHRLLPQESAEIYSGEPRQFQDIG